MPSPRGCARWAGASSSARPSSRCWWTMRRRRPRVRGVRVGGQDRAFDQVVSTIPLPYLVPLVPQLPADETRQGRGDPQRRRGVRAAQAQAALHAQLLDEHQRSAHPDPGPHRIQQPQPSGRLGHRLRALLHAADASQVRPRATGLHRRDAGRDAADPARLGPRRRARGHRVALPVRADRVHARLLRCAAADAQRRARAVPGRHLALLPRGPVDLREPAGRCAARRPGHRPEPDVTACNSKSSTATASTKANCRPSWRSGVSCATTSSRSTCARPTSWSTSAPATASSSTTSGPDARSRST